MRFIGYPIIWRPCTHHILSHNHYRTIMAIYATPAYYGQCDFMWKCILHYRVISYCIAGNFWGRKLSRISRFFSHPQKFSPRNSRHATLIMRPVLTFCEMLLSYRSRENFLPRKFPAIRYLRALGFNSIKCRPAQGPSKNWSKDTTHAK